MIVGHIPINNHVCRDDWASHYVQIVDRYAMTITAQVFGHTHADAFALGRNEQGIPTTLQFRLFVLVVFFSFVLTSGWNKIDCAFLDNVPKQEPVLEILLVRLVFKSTRWVGAMAF